MSGVNNDETSPTVQSNNNPQTLEDALRILRNGDQQSTDTTVGNASMGDSGTGVEEPQQVQQESTEENPVGETAVAEPTVSQDNNVAAGGYTASSGEVEETYESEPAVDYNAVGKAYVQSTQRLAIDAANKLFRDNQIAKVSINDLYNKDDRGRVSFNNPDDPDHPFASRYEAQQWCDAVNSQIDAEWKNTVTNYQREYLKDIQPMLRLMDFAPEFDAMSPQEQKIFDNIVEGYKVTDKSGMVIGYSCDLRNAKQIASNIWNSMNEGKTDTKSQTVPQVQGGGPALDAKTSGTGNPQNNHEAPKNLNEAMKMLADSKKKKESK